MLDYELFVYTQRGVLPVEALLNNLVRHKEHFYQLSNKFITSFEKRDFFFDDESSLDWLTYFEELARIANRYDKVVIETMNGIYLCSTHTNHRRCVQMLLNNSIPLRIDNKKAKDARQWACKYAGTGYNIRPELHAL
tara:strand:- start:338 stop:748 length:411 start_codon:yes stop_codon:yes gene_type:complete